MLSDICLNLEAGQTIGIIGQTGAAKSTLVQLIPRLYEATKGCVYVDDVPVQEYPLEHLRDAIAMVLQKNTLFSGTVRDNLAGVKRTRRRRKSTRRVGSPVWMNLSTGWITAMIQSLDRAV